jgi:hypothetical protein
MGKLDQGIELPRVEHDQTLPVLFSVTSSVAAHVREDHRSERAANLAR